MPRDGDVDRNEPAHLHDGQAGERAMVSQVVRAHNHSMPKSLKMIVSVFSAAKVDAGREVRPAGAARKQLPSDAAAELTDREDQCRGEAGQGECVHSSERNHIN